MGNELNQPLDCGLMEEANLLKMSALTPVPIPSKEATEQVSGSGAGALELEGETWERDMQEWELKKLAHQCGSFFWIQRKLLLYSYIKI